MGKGDELAPALQSLLPPAHPSASPFPPSLLNFPFSVLLDLPFPHAPFLVLCPSSPLAMVAQILPMVQGYLQAFPSSPQLSISIPEGGKPARACIQVQSHLVHTGQRQESWVRKENLLFL